MLNNRVIIGGESLEDKLVFALCKAVLDDKRGEVRSILTLAANLPERPKLLTKISDKSIDSEINFKKIRNASPLWLDRKSVV
jgi:hypothetical protein